MALILHVDTERWRAHQDGVVARHPGLVPVAKGVNGYGLGIPNLLKEAARLAARRAVDIAAVGTAAEAEAALDHFAGSAAGPDAVPAG